MPPKTAKKPLGQQAASVTQVAVGDAANTITQVRLRRKRKYTPRARKCACGCGQIFTPKLSRGRYIDVSHRARAYRRKHRKGSAPAKRETVLDLLTCEHCGLDFLGNGARQQKYCSTRCRNAASKVRRHAAELALSQALGMSIEKARDVIDATGMKELQRVLAGLGMTYDPSSRQWGVLVSEGVFVRQESA